MAYELMQLVSPIDLIDFTTLGEALTLLLVKIVVAGVILITGILIGMALDVVVKTFVKKTGIEKSLGDQLAHSPLTSFLFSLPKYLVYFFTVVIALDAVGFSFMRGLIVRAVEYLPNIFSAFLVLLVGFLFAGLLSKVFSKHLLKADAFQFLREGRSRREVQGLLEDFFRTFIYFLTVLVALEQLNLAPHIIQTTFTAVMIIFAGGVLLLFYFGLKLQGDNIVAGFTLRSGGELKKAEKDGTKYKVERVGFTHTRLSTGKTLLVVPNKEIVGKYRVG
jgi:hypothetical protein